jgi:polyphosphate kinase 2
MSESDDDKKLKRKKYAKRFEPMQGELLQMARWVEQSGQRLLILFEGRDTAGKGGVIGDIAGTLNPRQCRTVALGKPDEREQKQWYFQRYIDHLPAAGEIVLFDRSWYNRAGVEKVMGYCTDAQYKAFLEQTPLFEKLLTDDGILLFKYWLCVDQARQEERFAERASDPLKRWKLSPIDLKARTHYAEYGHARDAMLKATHTRSAPWALVDFNDQKRGRLTLIRHLLDALPDTQAPESPIALPSLKHKPEREHFDGPLKPLPDAFPD